MHRYVNQSRLKTNGGSGLIEKGGPHLYIYPQFIVMRAPIAFSFRWISTNLYLMYIIWHEILVNGALFIRGTLGYSP